MEQIQLNDNVSDGLINKSLSNVRIHLLCSTEVHGYVEALTESHQVVYFHKFKTR